MLESILKNVRVLDLTQNIAGPFCTEILADFGAEVIKIERPGTGDDTRSWRPPVIGGESATFLALNRNKKSVGIDLGRPEGRALVHELAAGADVFVHSMRPGSSGAKAFGYEALGARNAGLIYLSISAYGETGPMKELPGYDPLLQAFTGIVSVSGGEGDPPSRVGPSIVDMGTGMWSAIGILGALIERGRSGRGMRVETSLLGTGLSWMTLPIASYLASGRLPRRMGSATPVAAPYELFRTTDGLVFIAAGNDRLYRRICEALGCPELGADPRFADNALRLAARPELHDLLEARTALRSTADNLALLRAAGAPCSEVNDVSQAVAHEQVAASGMIVGLPVEGAPAHRAVALPIAVDGARSAALAAPPRLGEHTDEVLRAAGITDARLAALRSAGVIA